MCGAVSRLTTLPLHCILEMALPVARCVELVGIVSEVQRRQPLVRRHRRQSCFRLHVRMQRVVLVRRAVIIAKRDERAHLKLNVAIDEHSVRCSVAANLMASGVG